MKALAIKQPWAWLILNAGKDIENRSWKCNFRGTVLIHASLKFSHDDWLDGLESLRWIRPDLVSDFPAPNQFQTGGIVGQMDIVNCVPADPSKWFTGPFGWKITAASPLPIIPCRGSLGFFTPNLYLP